MAESHQHSFPLQAFDLSKTPLHFDGQSVTPVEGFTHDEFGFNAYIAKYCSDGNPGRLFMLEATPNDWPGWECHTQGDEIVIVLEGAGTFIQELDGEEYRIPFGPGSVIVNPSGVWHTADVEESMRAIYVTPCPGTEQRGR